MQDDRVQPDVLTQMLAEHGALETARRLINAPTVSDGFTTLWERHRLDLSVEAIAGRDEFAPLFSAVVLATAKRRLDEFGYTPGR